MRFYLRPISFLYDQVVGVKNALYDRGMIGSYKAPVPVISIGNLTVGGTGKTPITDFCLKQLVQGGFRVAVVSRSYRALAKEPCLVDPKKTNAAGFYGDEPVLLAKSNPTVSVFVGPSKWKTVQYAVSEQKFDLIIVDDGFQHRRLQRDLNIVILDATEVLSNYEVLPEGRARESWASLNRADLVLVTKCNQASEDDLAALEKKIPDNKEVLHFAYDIDHFRNQGGAAELSRDQFQDKKFFLVSAIARPDVFEKMMREIGKVAKHSLHYRDHHPYSAADVEKMTAEFKKSDSDYLVTTEKDAVKLQSLFPLPEMLWSATLKVSELGHKGRLYEIISQLLRPTL